MNRRKLVTVLLLALTSGGLASYLSLGSIARSATAAPVPIAPSGVIVAARTLPPGTMIQAGDLRRIPWAADTPPVGVFASTEEVVGRVLVVGLGAEEPVLASLLAPTGSGSGLPGLIPAGMRAISVSVDEVVGVNGFVGPGARVDVIATMDVTGGNGEAVSRVVLQDVEVAASGHQLQADPNGAPQQATVATLLVSPAEAEELVLATHRGRVQLVLRGSTDREAISTPGIKSSAMMGAAPPAANSTAPTVRAPRAEAPARSRTPKILIVAADGSGKTVVRY
jgi:pilus assembly protein CpaB